MKHLFALGFSLLYLMTASVALAFPQPAECYKAVENGNYFNRTYASGCTYPASATDHRDHGHYVPSEAPDK